MKLRTKQISLGALAAVTIVAVPVATVISCGSESKDGNSNGGPNTSGAETVTHKIIDLSKVNSTTELFDVLNKKLNNFMPKKATEMSGASLDQNKFKGIETYMKNINSDIQTITLKLGDKKVTWNLAELNKTVKGVITEMKAGFANLKTINIISLMNAKDNPTMSVYPAKQSAEGVLFGMKLQGFASLPGKGFDFYKEMLNEYHALAQKFIKSDVYKTWIKDKEFILVNGDLGGKPTIEKVKPGTKYDDRDPNNSALASVAGLGSNTFAAESNNFEAQWVLSIMKLDK